VTNQDTEIIASTPAHTPRSILKTDKSRQADTPKQRTLVHP